MRTTLGTAAILLVTVTLSACSGASSPQPASPTPDAPAATDTPAATNTSSEDMGGTSQQPPINVTPGSAFREPAAWVIPDGRIIPAFGDGNMFLVNREGALSAHASDGSKVWEAPKPEGASGTDVVRLDESTVAVMWDEIVAGSGASRDTIQTVADLYRTENGEKIGTVEIPNGVAFGDSTTGMGAIVQVGDDPATADFVRLNVDATTSPVAPIDLTLPTMAGGQEVRSVPSYVWNGTVVHEWGLPGGMEFPASDAFGNADWNSVTSYPSGADPSTGQVLSAVMGVLVGGWKSDTEPDTGIIAVINPETGEFVGTPLECAGATIPETPQLVTTSPDGRYVAVGELAAVDTTTGTGMCLTGTADTRSVTPTAASNDGVMYGATWDHKPVMFDLSAASPTTEDLPGATYPPVAVVGDVVVFRAEGAPQQLVGFTKAQ